jgi:asparagine synthase (glutamine-hydrolysing)
VCGIAGKLNFDRTEAVSLSLLKAMSDAIQHRGPDDEGFYASESVGFGFRRLSIIDLNTGHQPLSNEDGTVWIVFNGEIYNYRELRHYLEAKGHVFKTQADTEVIVHLYEQHGVDCLRMLNGMFAFALWDERKKILFIARDRVGIKPLYFSITDRALIFGSEIKALLADPEVVPAISLQMIDRFLTFYYLPGEETLFENVRKLAPGSYILVQDSKISIKEYWDLKFLPAQLTVRQAEEALVSLVDHAVQQHMISDVPIGFLLSGGVDSTAMLSFAVGKTDRPLSSFTLGFADSEVVDERPYARLASQRYGSEHHEMTISAVEFAEFLPKYTWHMEEPVCEPTAVALYYVSRLARKSVKVVISGEGGDEAFAGYPNYRNLLWLERLKSTGSLMSEAIASGLATVNRLAGPGRCGKYAPLMRMPLASYYYSRISGPGTFFNTHGAQLYSGEFAESVDKGYSLNAVNRHFANCAGAGMLNQMLYVDTKTALPDDLLLKADKMTMANSVELRVPLLDHRVLEFAASLPENFKVRGATTKYIAKRALRHRLPPEILKRKKVGFPVPFGRWLGHELKEFVDDILRDKKTISRGYFREGCVEKLIKQHAELGCFSKEILSLVSLELMQRIFVDEGNKHSRVLVSSGAL